MTHMSSGIAKTLETDAPSSSRAGISPEAPRASSAAPLAAPSGTPSGAPVDLPSLQPADAAGETYGEAGGEDVPGVYRWVQRLSKPWMLIGSAAILFAADRLTGIPVFLALLIAAAIGCGMAAALHYRRERE